MGLRESILKAVDSKVELVEVPEWKTSVHVRTWTGAERDRIEARFVGMSKGHPTGARALIACISVCDADGTRVFKDSDEPELAKKSGNALDRIFQAATTLNAFGEDAVEDEVKNS